MSDATTLMAVVGAMGTLATVALSLWKLKNLWDKSIDEKIKQGVELAQVDFKAFVLTTNMKMDNMAKENSELHDKIEKGLLSAKELHNSEMRSLADKVENIGDMFQRGQTQLLGILEKLLDKKS